MLIKCKNGDLYRGWIDYLVRIHGCENNFGTPEIRTRAFFESQAGNTIPLS